MNVVIDKHAIEINRLLDEKEKHVLGSVEYESLVEHIQELSDKQDLLADQLVLEWRQMDSVFPRTTSKNVSGNVQHSSVAIPLAYSIMTQLEKETYQSLLAYLPYHSERDKYEERPLGEKCLIHLSNEPQSRKITPREKEERDLCLLINSFPIIEEPIFPDTRKWVCQKIKEQLDGIGWLSNNRIEWSDGITIQAGIIPFLGIRVDHERYLTLTCLSSYSDHLYRIRIPYLFDRIQRVGIQQDGVEYSLYVRLAPPQGSDPFPTRISFFGQTECLEFHGVSIANQTDCCVISNWVSGYIQSPYLSRYFNLCNNLDKNNAESLSTAFGTDIVVKKFIQSIFRTPTPFMTREIYVPTNPDLPNHILYWNLDTLFTLYESPYGNQHPCYFAIDVVNQGSTYQREALYRLFDSFGMNRSLYCVTTIFTHQHALLLTYTGEGPRRYECLELQVGFRRDAYDHLMVRNAGYALIYLNLTPNRQINVVSKWTPDTVSEMYDPFSNRTDESPCQLMKHAYDPPSDEDSYLLQSIKESCALEHKTMSKRKQVWTQSTLRWMSPWQKADWNVIATLYEQEWVEEIGQGDSSVWREIAKKYPHLVVHYHLLIRSGIMKRNECIEFHRNYFRSRIVL